MKRNCIFQRLLICIVALSIILSLVCCQNSQTDTPQNTHVSTQAENTPATQPTLEDITEVETSPATESATESATETNTEPLPLIALNITGGRGEVYPYIDEMKSFLKAIGRVNIANYAYEIEYPAKAIRLEWEPLVDSITGYTLRYFPAGQESSAVEVTLSKSTRYYELYNLFKNQDYAWSLTAELEDGTSYTEEATFHTTNIGPRVLRIRSVYNTRDAGGYVTESGQVTKQGMMIRGGKLPETLPDHAQNVFTQTLGIRMELDLRGYTAESGYRTESPIQGAKLEQIQIDGYSAAFDSDWTENYRQIFSLMADPNHYPMYIHCTAGADRTGTIIFLVNALLGVPEELLIQDYELTSFSVHGIRSTYDPRDGGFGSLFAFFQNRLHRYKGETLAQKTENYMLSIGVTQDEIDSIRQIMLEDATA